MTRRSKTATTLQTLAMTAVAVVITGGLTLTFGSDAAPDQTTAKRQADSANGGCCCQAVESNREACPRRGRGPEAMQPGQERGHGARQGRGPGPAARPGRHANARGPAREVMQATHALVHDYRQDIVREIEDIPGGVVTVTRSPGNPEAVPVLQRHVREMKALLEGGGRIRNWDPLFSEIFDHYREIDMTIETLEDGVRVTETSADPEVVKLIRAHARKVNEFVARGPEAVHEATPLPE